MQKKRPVVVILGVHRSGTSLVANFVHAVGVELGQDLMPADEANEAGYWESTKVWQTHELVLKELNCDWHNPPISFPANWWRKPGIQELKSALLEFVRSECSKTDKMWGFKDPRTAILLPMWGEIFDELQLEPLYVLAVRHPASVAASLSKRNLMVAAHSEALWLKTHLDVLSHARNNLRAIVDYDRWFDSGYEQALTLINALNLSESVSETQIMEALDQVIHRQLRHHSHGEDTISSPIVAKFYSILLKATKDGEISDEILTIKETFERSIELLNIWDNLVTERDAIIAECHATIAERDATITERDIKIEADRTQLRKQRQLFTYIIISIVIVFSLILIYLLFGINN